MKLNKTLTTREKVARRRRAAAERQPEVFVMGELLGGSGFGSGVSCVWQIQAENSWELSEGVEQGQVVV